VVKVRLSDFTCVGALTLNPGEGYLVSAVIDTINVYAYFGTLTRPGSVVKVRLSDLSRVAALTLNLGEDALESAVIDTARGYAYFGTSTSPGMVVKIDVGFDNLVLTKSANSLTAKTGDNLTYTLAILNDSPATATGLTLTDTLPLGVTYLTASAGCGQVGGLVVCSLGSLPADAIKQAVIQVQVTSTATEFITNAALVSASEPRFSSQVSASVTTLLNPLRSYFPVVGR
jgi:uncharacterized repeat protein (TIGR01451 family)